MKKIMEEKFAFLISFAKKYPKYISAAVAVILVFSILTVFALEQNSGNTAALNTDSSLESTNETLITEASCESITNDLQSSSSNSDTGSDVSKSSANTSSKSTSTPQQPGAAMPTNNQEKITMISNYGYTLETSNWIYLQKKRYSKDMSQMYDFCPLGQYADYGHITAANNKIYFSAYVDQLTDNSRNVIAYCDSTGYNTKEIIKMNSNKMLFTIYGDRIYYIDQVEKSAGSSTYSLYVYSTDLEGTDKKTVATMDNENYCDIGEYMTVSDGYFFFNTGIKSKGDCIIRFTLNDYSYSTITPSSDKFSYRDPIFAKDNYLYYCHNKIVYRMKYDGSQLETFADFYSIANNTDSVDFIANDNGIFVCTLHSLYSVPYSGEAPVQVADYLKTNYIKIAPLNANICLLGTTAKKAIVYVKQ